LDGEDRQPFWADAAIGFEIVVDSKAGSGSSDLRLTSSKAGVGFDIVVASGPPFWNDTDTQVGDGDEAMEDREAC
jgi:hypothetical protein